MSTMEIKKDKYIVKALTRALVTIWSLLSLNYKQPDLSESNESYHNDKIVL